MDGNIAYETISFTGSLIGFWVALICGVIALALILLGILRLRRHRARAAQEDRNVDPNLVHDSGVQRKVGYVFAGVAAVALAVGGFLFFQDRAALQDNLQAKYPEVTEVANVEQTGMSFVADLTFEDGTTAERELILVASDGEPFYGRDILARPGNPEPLRSPGK